MCPELSFVILMANASQTFINGKQKGQIIYCILIHHITLFCLRNFSIIRKLPENSTDCSSFMQWKTHMKQLYNSNLIASVSYLLLLSDYQSLFSFSTVFMLGFTNILVSRSSTELLKCLILSTHVCEMSVLVLPFHTPCNAWQMTKHSNNCEALKQWAFASQSSFCELFIREFI